MMSSGLLFLVVAGCIAEVAARDVPLGECHSCEVNCFENCGEQFYIEVIQAERREYELKQRMLREHGGGHLSARGLAGVTASLLEDAPPKDNKGELHQALDEFEQCLEKEGCPTHNIPSKPCSPKVAAQGKASFLKKSDKKAQCVAGEQPCMQKCARQAVGTKNAALLQKHYPQSPVKRGGFAEGRMTLDFCLKACLASTCGCRDAPGFAKIDKLYGQVAKNIEGGEPVTDTAPVHQYRPATQQECANGIPGKKVSSGLYINFGSGWNEVCTQEQCDAFFGPAYSGCKEQLKRCKSRALEDQKFGCSWDEQTQQCTDHSNTPSFTCHVRFFADKTL